jgi:multicomponent Na+:H+ antiporter subunit E
MKIIWKVYKILEFLVFYFSKVIQANFHLAWRILQPRLNMKPGIIKIPIKLKKKHAILLLVNLISMTPGSFTLDLTEDRKCIYVHFLFVSSEEKVLNDIKQLENRVSTLFK